MCILIDINVYSEVFSSNNANHEAFKPVLDWIIDGPGTMIYGGKKYNEEIPQKYRSFILELEKAGNAKRLKGLDSKIDEESNKFLRNISNSDFDDPHILAILTVSGCRILCSNDQRLFPFIKERAYYPDKKIAKIYTQKSARCADKILSEKLIPKHFKKTSS